MERSVISNGANQGVSCGGNSDSKARESKCNARPSVEDIYIMSRSQASKYCARCVPCMTSSLLDFISVKHAASFTVYYLSPLWLTV